MRTGDGGWSAVRELADRQFGLFTAAQARERGVAAYELARMAHRDLIVRVHHGVYEVPESDAPRHPTRRSHLTRRRSE